MAKPSSSFQRSIILMIFFTLFNSYDARNPFDNLDLNTQTLIPGVTGFTITGNAANDRLGTLSTAGDINGDGYDDIIVGASSKDTNQGAVYVIYGGEESSFLNIDLGSTSLNPQQTGFTITGEAIGDFFGFSISTADIDNDGYDDIIVGAYRKNSGRGKVYVIYGGAKSSMTNIVLSSTTLLPASTGFTIIGNAGGNYLGNSVSGDGDINNDGYDDIIVGAYQRNNIGAAYVIYGGARSTRSNIDLSTTPLIPASTGFMITGNAAGDNFGLAVSTAGDIDKDGYDDIIVSTPYKNSNQGAAYVIYGGEKSTRSNIVLTTPLLPASTGFMITGKAVGDFFGYSVSTAGDINNDGYDDIVVGAQGKDSSRGAAYVIYGGAKPTMTNIVLSSTTLLPASTGFMITGSAVNDYLGTILSAAGDLNHDGYDDIIVGTQAKTAYVIYGGAKSAMSDIPLSSTTLDPTTTGFVITGNAAGVSTVGDINNDGYDDIIVGAWVTTSDKGGAYVIYASCSQYCKQCSSESVCTQCKGTNLMYQAKCFATCPEATIAISTTACGDCPANCKHCSSTTVCTQCKDSYISYLSQCLDACPDGMFFSGTTCQACQSPCSKCTSLSACTACISPLILYESMCFPSCPITMFNSNGVCTSCPSYCSSCTSQDSCQVCFDGYTLSNSLCVLPSFSASASASDLSYVEAKEKATKAISSATQGIGSVLCVGSAVFPFSALVSKIVQNTRYLNLSVTADLAGVYKTWQTDIISWDVPNVMSDLDHFKTAPDLFVQYDIDSPFLVNFWPTLLNVGIGFGIFVVCIFFQKIFEHEKYEGWAYSLVRKLVAGSFNFALIQAYACLDDILFYLVIDAKTNPFNSFFSWASIICAILFLAIGCLQVFFNFWTVCKYQSIKKQGEKEREAFNEKNKYWELFYSDFNDGDLWSQSFFALAIIRSVLSSFIITVLYEYPLMQASYLVTLDIGILSFLYLKAPFNTLRGTLAQYYYEIITLLVHLCAFILAMQDTFNKSSSTVRLIMSTGILYLNTALVSGAIGFMFIEIYKTISEKKRAARLKQPKTIPEDTQETQNLQSPEITAQKRQYWINREQIISNENFHLEPSGINLESSQRIESNFNAENSREFDMDPNQQGDQSTVQGFYRPLPRRFNRNQSQKRSVRPNNAIHPARFVNG